jgi:hypothetical protein
VKQLTKVIAVATVVFASVPRLPAPITEESPTPAPEQTAKPKPKRTIKPEVTSENAKNSTKARPSSLAPQNQPTPNRNPFDGTWVGTINCGCMGDVQFAYVITKSGTMERDTSSLGTYTRNATCDGKTMRYQFAGNGFSTITPTVTERRQS